MQRSLIDTDILSFYLKGDPVVVNHFQNYLDHFDFLTFSIISYYEIYSGLFFRDANKLLGAFQKFVSLNEVIPLDQNSCDRSSELYAITRKEGMPIDDLDLLIAGIAIEHNCVLVTNNERHFSKIPGLQTQNWKKS